jgi:hypothetical protein
LLRGLGLAALLLLPSCGGGSSDDPKAHPPVAQTNLAAQQKRVLLGWVRQYYLYPDTLPAAVDVEAHQGPGDLLETLVKEARQQGLDRWSRVNPGSARTLLAQADPDGPVAIATGESQKRAGVTAAMTTRVWPGPGDQLIGYLRFRVFNKQTGHALRHAVGQLRQAQVTDLILDLRGNSGGRVDTQELLLNLLRRDAVPGEVMQRKQERPGTPEQVVYFKPEPQAIQPRRIAVLTDRHTASASEFALSALAPHYGPGLVQFGARTAGKPVGSSIIFSKELNLVVNLVSLRHLNRDGLCNWFRGLPCPGFPSPTCAVAKAPGRALDDPEEAGTRAALTWLRTGQIPGEPIPD